MGAQSSVNVRASRSTCLLPLAHEHSKHYEARTRRAQAQVLARDDDAARVAMRYPSSTRSFSPLGSNPLSTSVSTPPCQVAERTFAIGIFGVGARPGGVGAGGTMTAVVAALAALPGPA